MRLIRFIADDGRTLHGVDHGDGSASIIAGSVFDVKLSLGPRAGIRRLLAPIIPPNIVCIGRNYPPAPRPPALIDHELEVFLKPTTAIQNPGDPIIPPDFGGLDPQLDVEGELAVIIGRTTRNVSELEATDYVLGYSIANDVTAKAFQTASGPPLWTRGKGFDTFCPLGPAIVTTDELGDPQNLALRTFINGALVRDGDSSRMIWPVRRIIAAISRRMTLPPGTLILTGAPGFVSGQTGDPLASGASVRVEIERLGTLENRVN